MRERHRFVRIAQSLLRVPLRLYLTTLTMIMKAESVVLAICAGLTVPGTHCKRRLCMPCMIFVAQNIVASVS